MAFGAKIESTISGAVLRKTNKFKIMDTSQSSASPIIPQNIQGKATDLEESVVAQNKEDALKIFRRAAMRLKNVPVWHKLCGALSAEFILAGNDGNPVLRLAEKNDYFMIDIPGPGMREGDGYDWVKVMSIQEEMNEHGDAELLALIVGSCANPATTGNETAHFFKEGATSTFMIQRLGSKVTASYHGRNELPNTDVKRLTDKLRNTVVAIGAYGGLSVMQWQALIKAFLQDEI
ncbi:MAG: hypothetical protein ABJA37_03040 [Ferruginibacter sp.]